MNHPMMIDGRYFASRTAAMDHLLAAGYVPVHVPTSRHPHQLEHPDGSFYSSRDVTLTAWRYAAKVAGLES